MAVLAFADLNDEPQSRTLGPDERVRLGAAVDSTLRLASGLSVLPHHAIICRSVLYGVWVLVDLAGREGDTRVNTHRFVRLKTLRHRDRIQLGHAEVVFWEMVIENTTADSPWFGKRCPVCYGPPMNVGEPVVFCPRCQTPHHRDCWFGQTICSCYGCEYPVQAEALRALPTRVLFDSLEEGSDLVVQKAICSAGELRDQSPFKPGEHVAYCPGCGSPYHAACFFGLRECPVCKYDAAALIADVFAREGHPAETAEGVTP